MSTIEFDNLIESEIVKSFRNLISRIGSGYTFKETQSSAGYQLHAVPESKSTNLPRISVIVNILGDIFTVRFEAAGNLSHYIIEEIILKVFQNLRPLEIELTELETGRVRIQLNRRNLPAERLYQAFKKEYFSYYANEDGRLLILLDDEPETTSPIAISADPLKIRPKQATFKPKPIERGIKQERAINHPIFDASQEEGIPGKVPTHLEESETTQKSTLDERESVTLRERTKMAKLEQKKTKKDSKVLEEPIKGETKESLKLEKEILPSEVNSYDSLSVNEKFILDLIEKKPKQKVQSKGLKKEISNLDQGEIKEILRSLVAKGFLFVEAAWYIRKDPNEVIEKKSEKPLEERIKLLNSKEKKVFEILSKREGNKAQARMLTKSTKMNKDNIKKILRDMVMKDVLYVDAAWYVIKE